MEMEDLVLPWINRLYSHWTIGQRVQRVQNEFTRNGEKDVKFDMTETS